MISNDIVQKITRIFFSFLFVFAVSFFILPNEDASALCTKVNPVVEFIPIVGGDTVSGAMGNPFSYTIRVTNNDTDDGVPAICGPFVAYDLSIAPVAVGLDLESHTLPLTVNVNTGGFTDTTFTVTSKAIGLGLGNYNFNVIATDSMDVTKTDFVGGIYNINAIDVEICNNGIDDDVNGNTDCDDIGCLSDPFCCGDGSVDGAEGCDTNLPISCVAPTPVCLNDCTGCVAALPGCAIGTGNCDGIAANGCETDLFTDSVNCGSCDNACKAGYCAGGICPTLPEGGIVPCGRLVDDPSTSWVELQPCKICHFVILASEIINFLMGLVVLITILAIIVSGLIHVKAGGNISMVLAAKQGMNKILLGFVIIFTTWAIVNTSMVLFGFNDPLEDGNWAKFDCDLGSFIYCGDNIVQNPNDMGEIEECETGETSADYTARKIAMAIGCADGDGNCPDGCFSDAGAPTDNDCGPVVAAWAEDVSRCNSSCKIACKNDPLASKIGEGCFLASDPCQKGRYACDLEGGGVSCLDIYGDPKYATSPWYLNGALYDYCCDNDHTNFADGFVGHANTTPFTIERGGPYMVAHGLASFHCEDVCADVGKVCVGVGLANPATSSCIYVIHDNGSNCNLPGNNAATNCSATFSRRNPCDCTSGGVCFGVRETACYCAF